MYDALPFYDYLAVAESAASRMARGVAASLLCSLSFRRCDLSLCNLTFVDLDPLTRRFYGNYIDEIDEKAVTVEIDRQRDVVQRKPPPAWVHAELTMLLLSWLRDSN